MRPGQGTDQRLVGGRYAIHDLLGTGGMGRVWRAEDQLLRRPVAVKEIEILDALPDSERSGTRDRVLREARAAARSSHPHSVAVYDVVEEDDRVFIVMELVDAPTLDDVVRSRGALPPAEVAKVGLAVLDALAAAHASGVVHRDVKPGNVMVTDRGDAKLTDFGIAAVKEDVTRTMTGLVRGSPAYMAPEQARGEATGPATDLWALGATLYFAVEGEPPWDRDGAIPTLTAIVTDDPRPMQKAGPLAPILTRMLDKDSGARPTSDEIRRDLTDVAAGAGAGSATAATTAAMAATQLAPTAVAPAPVPPPPRAATTAAAPVRRPPERSGRSAFGWVVAALILLLAGGLVALGLASANDDDDPGGDSAGSTTTAAPADEAAPAETEEQPETTTTTEATTTTTTEAPADVEGLPDGWTTYTDPVGGYTIGHPADWEVVKAGATATDIKGPDGSYLRVDWTATPGDDPVAAWEQQESSFAAEHDDYERIRIEPTEFQGHDGAIWEFTYTDGGADLHAENLGFTTSVRGYALYFQTKSDGWDDGQDIYESFQDTFRAG